MKNIILLSNLIKKKKKVNNFKPRTKNIALWWEIFFIGFFKMRKLLFDIDF